jgi:putative acyl-CoA dehydrogenase
VNALDVLRALEREPETGLAFLEEVGRAAGADPRLDAAIAGLEGELAAPDEASARRLLESLATTLQASLLVRHAPHEVADAFCASRLDGHGGVYGTLPSGLDLAGIASRHTPRL